MRVLLSIGVLMALVYTATPAGTLEREYGGFWVRHVKGEAGYPPMTLRKNASALPPVILMTSASE